MTYVYVQLPPEIAGELANFKRPLPDTAVTSEKIERDYLQLVDGYDTATQTAYPKMELEDAIANGIWWTIDANSTPGVPATDASGPLAWALFGKNLLTTEIDTGYGGPTYTPPTEIAAVTNALHEATTPALKERVTELVNLGHLAASHAPLLAENLQKLQRFYDEATKTHTGVLVTIL